MKINLDTADLKGKWIQSRNPFKVDRYQGKKLKYNVHWLIDPKTGIWLILMSSFKTIS